jgi:hypothetical protein
LGLSYLTPAYLKAAEIADDQCQKIEKACIRRQFRIDRAFV